MLSSNAAKTEKAVRIGLIMAPDINLLHQMNIVDIIPGNTKLKKISNLLALLVLKSRNVRTWSTNIPVIENFEGI